MTLRKRKPPRKVKRVNADQQLRWRVFEIMASPDIEGHVLIQNMDAITKWLKDGIVRTADGKPVLKVAATG